DAIADVAFGARLAKGVLPRTSQYRRHGGLVALKVRGALEGGRHRPELDRDLALYLVTDLLFDDGTRQTTGHRRQIGHELPDTSGWKWHIKATLYAGTLLAFLGRRGRNDRGLGSGRLHLHGRLRCRPLNRLETSEILTLDRLRQGSLALSGR